MAIFHGNTVTNHQLLVYPIFRQTLTQYPAKRSAKRWGYPRLATCVNISIYLNYIPNFVHMCSWLFSGYLRYLRCAFTSDIDIQGEGVGIRGQCDEEEAWMMDRKVVTFL